MYLSIIDENGFAKDFINVCVYDCFSQGYWWQWIYKPHSTGSICEPSRCQWSESIRKHSGPQVQLCASNNDFIICPSTLIYESEFRVSWFVIIKYHVTIISIDNICSKDVCCNEVRNIWYTDYHVVIEWEGFHAVIIML